MCSIIFNDLENGGMSSKYAGSVFGASLWGDVALRGVVALHEVVALMSLSSYSQDWFDVARKELGITRGLQSVAETRFGSIYWNSVYQLLSALFVTQPLELTVRKDTVPKAGQVGWNVVAFEQYKVLNVYNTHGLGDQATQDDIEWTRWAVDDVEYVGKAVVMALLGTDNGKGAAFILIDYKTSVHRQSFDSWRQPGRRMLGSYVCQLESG
ncbi:hypothetical protein GGX14DRAFT_390347 [Mycena pura]|uniref:Uncharacterized protein n=1 Tax=Mycena pura TaxID=153505 RepID=A0AAD6VP46_9AGAR|nr:hypothetical protein GGX14DRAFT_390347 [Mycena pura]